MARLLVCFIDSVVVSLLHWPNGDQWARAKLVYCGLDWSVHSSLSLYSGLDYWRCILWAGLTCCTAGWIGQVWACTTGLECWRCILWDGLVMERMLTCCTVGWIAQVSVGCKVGVACTVGWNADVVCCWACCTVGWIAQVGVACTVDWNVDLVYFRLAWAWPVLWAGMSGMLTYYTLA